MATMVTDPVTQQTFLVIPVEETTLISTQPTIIQKTTTRSSSSSYSGHTYSYKSPVACSCIGCMDNCPSWVQKCLKSSCCGPRIMPLYCVLALGALVGGSVALNFADELKRLHEMDFSALIPTYLAIGIPCVIIGALVCVLACARFFRGPKCDKACECPYESCRISRSD